MSSSVLLSVLKAALQEGSITRSHWKEEGWCFHHLDACFRVVSFVAKSGNVIVA